MKAPGLLKRVASSPLRLERLRKLWAAGRSRRSRSGGALDFGDTPESRIIGQLGWGQGRSVDEHVVFQKGRERDEAKYD